MRILVATPDSLVNPMGGLGVALTHLLTNILRLQPSWVVDVLFVSVGDVTAELKRTGRCHVIPTRTHAPVVPWFDTDLDTGLACLLDGNSRLLHVVDYYRQDSSLPDLVWAFDFLSLPSAVAASQLFSCRLVFAITLSQMVEGMALTKRIETTRKDNDSSQGGPGHLRPPTVPEDQWDRLIDKMEVKHDLYQKIFFQSEQWGAQHARAIIVCSRHYVIPHLALPHVNHKVHYIANGVEAKKLRTLAPLTGKELRAWLDRTDRLIYIPSSPLYPPPSAKLIVFMSRLTVPKNLLSVLEAEEKCEDWPEDVHLVVVAPQRRSAARMVVDALKRAASDPRRRVHNWGECSGDERFRVMKACDAVIFPSRHEPYGLVGLEALACGVSLVTTGVEGMNDYLGEGEDACWRCASVEAQDIARAVAAWRYSSVELVHSKRLRGWAIAQECRWDARAQDHVTLFEQTLRAPPTSNVLVD